MIRMKIQVILKVILDLDPPKGWNCWSMLLWWIPWHFHLYLKQPASVFDLISNSVDSKSWDKQEFYAEELYNVCTLINIRFVAFHQCALFSLLILPKEETEPKVWRILLFDDIINVALEVLWAIVTLMNVPYQVTSLCHLSNVEPFNKNCTMLTALVFLFAFILFLYKWDSLLLNIFDINWVYHLMIEASLEGK